MKRLSEGLIQVNSADKAFQLGARAATDTPGRAIQYALRGSIMLAKRMNNRRLLAALQRAGEEAGV